MKKQEQRGVGKGYKNAANYRDINKFLEDLTKWNQSDKNKYIMYYHEMTSEPLRVLEEIDDLLGTNATIKKVFKELQSIRAPRKGHDPITLMTETHNKFYESS